MRPIIPCMPCGRSIVAVSYIVGAASYSRLANLQGAFDARDEELQRLREEVLGLRKAAVRAKESAKFDKKARDGQAKKVDILEHSVEVLQHDLRIAVENRWAALTRERASSGRIDGV